VALSESEAPSRSALLRECWVASIGVLLFIGAVKHIGAFVPFVGRHAFTITAAVQLYVPIFLIGRWGITRASLGLVPQRGGRDLAIVAVLGVATIVPFGIGHHYWQTEINKLDFAFRWPPEVLVGVFNQVMVALVEELFFRGYLQGRMEQLWPAKRRLFGVPFGRAIIFASVVFALAHFVGEYRPDRLGPFFPALLFGLLRTKTGSIVAPVAYHAFCNVLGDVLWASYSGS